MHYDDANGKSNMADVRHIENSFSAIFQRHVVRLTRNSEWRSRIKCWHVSRDQCGKFRTLANWVTIKNCWPRCSVATDGRTDGRTERNATSVSCVTDEIETVVQQWRTVYFAHFVRSGRRNAFTGRWNTSNACPGSRRCDQSASYRLLSIEINIHVLSRYGYSRPGNAAGKIT